MPGAAAGARLCVVPGSCQPGAISLSSAFQFLDCLDLNVCARRMLTIMSKHLQGKCRERRHLALRGFVALNKYPLMVSRGQWLKPCWLRGAGECSPLGLAEAAVPALPPPRSAAQVLWDGPLASGPCDSRMGLKCQDGLSATAAHRFTAQSCVPHRLKAYATCLQSFWSS